MSSLSNPFVTAKSKIRIQFNLCCHSSCSSSDHIGLTHWLGLETKWGLRGVIICEFAVQFLYKDNGRPCK